MTHLCFGLEATGRISVSLGGGRFDVARNYYSS